MLPGVSSVAIRLVAPNRLHQSSAFIIPQRMSTEPGYLCHLLNGQDLIHGLLLIDGILVVHDERLIHVPLFLHSIPFPDVLRDGKQLSLLHKSLPEDTLPVKDWFSHDSSEKGRVRPLD